jgi:uncharacterized protein (TIGR02996 family)
MTDRELGLLRAVCADPADDAPRMILADWWDETGRPERAEFLRVQCALVRYPRAPTGLSDGFAAAEWKRRREDLRTRERELLDAHRADWFRLLSRRPGFGENEPLRWWPVASNEKERADRGASCPTLTAAIEGTPRRGFVAALTLTATDWLRHADALYWHPTQTGACERCAGDGKAHGSDRPFQWTPEVGYPGPCPGPCKGSGRVPRPFPPTAQPIEAVRLRTWPDFTHYAIDSTGLTSFRGRSRRWQLMDLLGPYRGSGGTGGALLAAEWPHVRFESLAESAAHYSREATAT